MCIFFQVPLLLLEWVYVYLHAYGVGIAIEVSCIAFFSLLIVTLPRELRQHANSDTEVWLHAAFSCTGYMYSHNQHAQCVGLPQRHCLLELTQQT